MKQNGVQRNCSIPTELPPSIFLLLLCIYSRVVFTLPFIFPIASLHFTLHITIQLTPQFTLQLTPLPSPVVSVTVVPCFVYRGISCGPGLREGREGKRRGVAWRERLERSGIVDVPTAVHITVMYCCRGRGSCVIRVGR